MIQSTLDGMGRFCLCLGSQTKVEDVVMKVQKAIRQGNVYQTREIHDLLFEKSEHIQKGDIDPEMSHDFIDAFLDAWIGELRGAVHRSVFYDDEFCERSREASLERVRLINDGRMCLVLNEELAPYGQRAEAYILEIALSIDVPRCVISDLLTIVYSKLLELAGKKGFEPLGLIEATSSRGVIVIRLWDDFLQPEMEWPVEVITG